MSTTTTPRVRHLMRARDLADARYPEPLTRRRPGAAAACLSRAHFSREFRRAFGESPHSYLLTRRLERAASLLRGTDCSVADICMWVGLTSVGSFTSSFTAAYGMSPDRLPGVVPAGGRAWRGSRRACCAPTAARRTARSEKTRPTDPA